MTFCRVALKHLRAGAVVEQGRGLKMWIWIRGWKWRAGSLDQSRNPKGSRKIL